MGVDGGLGVAQLYSCREILFLRTAVPLSCRCSKAAAWTKAGDGDHWHRSDPLTSDLTTTEDHVHLIYLTVALRLRLTLLTKVPTAVAVSLETQFRWISP